MTSLLILTVWGAPGPVASVLLSANRSLARFGGQAKDSESRADRGNETQLYASGVIVRVANDVPHVEIVAIRDKVTP